jgi:hypothetical protein
MHGYLPVELPASRKPNEPDPFADHRVPLGPRRTPPFGPFGPHTEPEQAAQGLHRRPCCARGPNTRERSEPRDAAGQANASGTPSGGWAGRGGAGVGEGGVAKDPERSVRRCREREHPPARHE